MSFRDSERYEYIRQPHVITFIIIGVVIISVAVITAVGRLREQNRLAGLPSAESCTELVGDSELCQFAAASEATADDPYTSVTTSTNTAGSTTITTVASESGDRIRTITQVDGHETEAYLLLDADTYVRDYSDGTWAHYHDDAFEPGAESVTRYDFSTPASQDVVEFRDRYKRQGEEPCDGRTCLKYEITGEDSSGQQTFIWFDTADFLLRRYRLIDASGTHTTLYSYDPVQLTVPEAVKEVDEETLLNLLGAG